MLGHTLFMQLSLKADLDVYATARSSSGLTRWLPPDLVKKIQLGVDANNFDTIIRAFASVKPDIVINCIGLIKQLPLASDPLSAITINSLLPHRISLICQSAGTKMIHISTDCVFDGKAGGYKETDIPNATDIYGRTKFAGEVPDALTLRTSIIGRELGTCHGLLEWFLSKRGTKVQGYKKSLFSGVTTNELSKLVYDIISSRKNLTGLYHVAAMPVSKFDLLAGINYYLENKVEIEPVDGEIIDRSLNGHKLKCDFKYTPPNWNEMLKEMLITDQMNGDL